MDKYISRRVLIFDEAGFSKVCSALLEMSGCSTDVLNEFSGNRIRSDTGVFVTSYPYGAFMLEEMKKRSIPTIVLLDNIDDGFVRTLHDHDNLYGMVKPLDYDKFKGLVRKLLTGSKISRAEDGII